MDYYKILNLKEDASLAQIEQAYKDLASFYNPENNTSKIAYKNFRLVTKAYNILKDIRQRELYMLDIKSDVEKETNNSGNLLDFNEYSKLEDFVIDNEMIDTDLLIEDYSDYQVINLELPYLHYLLDCQYEITYINKKVISSEGICPVCKGKGILRKDNKVISCKECLKTGKKLIFKEEYEKKLIKVEEKVVIDDSKIIVNISFIDKNEYIINGNEIIYRHKISQKEYDEGFNLVLKRDNQELIIKETDFEILNKKYVFMDKIINIEYILDKYKGKDLKGYILTNKNIIYLNPKDYSYSFSANDRCNLKIELDSKVIKVNELGKKGYNDSNGDLILEVIRVENNEELKIFFNKKIKKVSSRLFKLKGEYENHKFNVKRDFDYDDNYIYIGNKAHTIALRNFSVFKIIFPSLLLLFPILCFLIFGISNIFFILSICFTVLYVLISYFLMEVKI